MNQPLVRLVADDEPLPAAPEADAGHELVILDSVPDHAIGVCGNVSLYVWRRATRTTAMPAVIESFARAQRAGGGRFANFGLVEPNAAFPEAEMRARLARVMREASASMAASALTFEGSGFRATAVRQVAGGLALIARQPYPHRVFAAVDAASQWAVAEMRRAGASAPDHEAITAAMTALRRSGPALIDT